MIVTYLLFVLGIGLLVKGADWIVDSASSLAERFGISSLIIGLTVVAFGTSLPELVVNLFAAFKGSGEIAFGNIIGSNIANILLVLGFVACFGVVKLKRETVWYEIPFALFVTFVLFVLTGNLFGTKEFLTRNDGLILLSLFGVFLYYVFFMARKGRDDFDISTVVDKEGWKIGLKMVLGIAAIYFGGKWVVGGAIFIASQFGLSEFLISVTVIAIGTSLPELVVSLVAIMKKNADLAVGNIVGSNIFNVAWVLGIVPLISPLRIPASIGLDIGIMFLVTLVLLIFMFAGGKHELRRADGVLMLLFYVLYIWYVFIRG
jgi:cation:H+ antiporter